jgi:hypothetical protein
MLLDIVYTYVDNTDSEWLDQKNKDKNNNIIEAKFDIECRSNSNLNELLYSIRSLELYFKGMYDKIYIVSNNKILPKFLKNTDNIIMICDKELLGNTSYNSQAIESKIHEIPGLSEYYLYFNDDFILNGPVFLKDFLNNGKLIWYEETNIIARLVKKKIISKLYVSVISNKNKDTVHSARNYTKSIIKCYNNKQISHSCRIFKKSLVIKFYNKYSEYIDNLRLEKFRSEKTFCFVDAFCFWAEKNGHLILKNNYETALLVHNDAPNDAYNFLTSLYNKVMIKRIFYNNSEYKFLSILDSRKEPNCNKTLFLFLEEKYSKKSKYEIEKVKR